MTVSVWGGGDTWSQNYSSAIEVRSMFVLTDCSHVCEVCAISHTVCVHVVQAFKRMRVLESIFMPGGDGGTLDWNAIGKIAVELREARGNSTTAGVWVCAALR